MSHWSTSYIGLPYVDGGRERSGLDCWGLIRLAYLELDGIALPLLPGHYDTLALARAIEEQAKGGDWTEVLRPKERDAVVMSLREAPHHIGIWTDADGGKVLHTWGRAYVVAETLRSLRSRGLRSIKFYRYGLYH